MAHGEVVGRIKRRWIKRRSKDLKHREEEEKQKEKEKPMTSLKIWFKQDNLSNF